MIDMTRNNTVLRDLEVIVPLVNKHDLLDGRDCNKISHFSERQPKPYCVLTARRKKKKMRKKRHSKSHQTAAAPCRDFYYDCHVMVQPAILDVSKLTPAST